ncbi:hypothetical protein [Pseudooceanicola sp.]|uniref:hypothetical protein n=1 Tax=Pseudooceanicola sp. TaxID=1914328 RepID=UPI0035C689E9
MARKSYAEAKAPAIDWYGEFIQMGADLIAFGTRRLEKDLAFQREQMQAKPEDIPHLQLKFWQGVLEDYHEETGRMVDRAHKAGMPEL